MADRQFQPGEALAAFVDATHWWIEEVLPRAADADLDGPGLGEWTLGELIAHTTRAFTTTVQYVEPEPATGPDVLTASEYFRTGLSGEGIDDAVAERGRQEYAGLIDVVAAALERADTALQVVGTTLPGSTVRSPIGVLRFDQYLVTRTAEIVVHGLDLTAALGIDVPPPTSASSLALALLAECVRNDPDASSELLRAMTGRESLGDFTVFGRG